MNQKLDIQKLGIPSKWKSHNGSLVLSNQIKSLHMLSLIQYIPLKNLKLLDLSKNNISTLIFLRPCIFGQLNALCLNGNRIKDIEPLSSVRMRELKQLNLQKNDIENIVSLQKVQAQLALLSLSNNKIDNIEPLIKMQLSNIKLALSRNYIYNGQCLTKLEMSKLQRFQLHDCRITNIKFNLKASKRIRQKQTITDMPVKDLRLICSEELQTFFKLP